MQSVFEFGNVVKDFPTGFLRRKKLRALAGVTFTLEPGQVMGLVGPNRAGKTTIIKLLLSLAQPTSGTIKRFGKPSSNRQTLAKIGYVHENQAFPHYLTAQSLMEYYGALSLLPEGDVKKRVPQLLDMVGLADRSREPISRFSKGMIQRLAVAQALLNEPDLLVMDEPNEGLDLAGRKIMQTIVEEQRQLGRAVLLVSHVLSDVESLCNQLAVLVDGRFVYQGPIGDFVGKVVKGKQKSLEYALQKTYQRHSPYKTSFV